MKAMYLALMLALSTHLVQAMEAEKPESNPTSLSQGSQESEQLESYYQQLCTSEGCNTYDVNSQMIDVVAYKLSEKLGKPITVKMLYDTEAFEQFIVDHALTLPGDHKLLEGINVTGMASWQPTNPFTNTIFLVSYLSLTDEQRKHICETYNNNYETMTMPSKGVYAGGYIKDFNIPKGMIFRKDLFLKHVFKSSEQKKDS